jgi:HEAT repeat protein
MNQSENRLKNNPKSRPIPDSDRLKSLIANLGSKDMRVRVRARQSLVANGEPAVIPLVEALSNQEGWVRTEAAKALGQINMPWSSHANPKIINLLVQDLASKDGIVRVTARRSLVAIGRKAVNALVKALTSKNESVRWEAAKALGQIGDAVATEALVKALEDKMFDVRWLAAEGLIRIGDKAIVPLLRAVVGRQDSYWLREGAHHVLHDIEKGRLDEALQPVLRALEDVEPSVEVPYAAEKALEALAEVLPKRPKVRTKLD